MTSWFFLSCFVSNFRLKKLHSKPLRVLCNKGCFLFSIIIIILLLFQPVHIKTVCNKSNAFSHARKLTIKWFAYKQQQKNRTFYNTAPSELVPYSSIFFVTELSHLVSMANCNYWLKSLNFTYAQKFIFMYIL